MPADDDNPAESMSAEALGEAEAGTDAAAETADAEETAEAPGQLPAADADPAGVAEQAEQLLGALGSALDADPPPAADESEPIDSEELRRILNLEVPVIVKLAECKMPIRRVVNLAGGAIIEFDKHFEEPLDLMVNNCTIGRGIAVKVGEKFGLKISVIASDREKIQSLSG